MEADYGHVRNEVVNDKLHREHDPLDCSVVLILIEVVSGIVDPFMSTYERNQNDADEEADCEYSLAYNQQLVLFIQVILEVSGYDTV